ncbi:MAG: GGDEF domain-containing protein [Zoogloeaceae bacterium]|nr:GGDEF domain-containing protein [Zoogloeaceae bacterium]
MSTQTAPLSGDSAEKLYSAQLEALFTRTRTSSALAILPIILLAGMHFGHIASNLIFMWGVALLTVYAIRIAIAHGYLNRDRSKEASPLWLDIETMATAAAGGGWGSMMFLLDTGQLDMLFTVKLAFLAAASAFTMNSLAVIRFVYLAFLVPVFTIVSLHALMETPFLDTGSRYGLIASATLFFILLLIMSRSLHRLMDSSLQQRLEFSDLTRQLATSLAAEKDAHQLLEQQARQLEANQLRLHVFATHDPLTRVFNHHRISETLVRELHMQQRYGTPVSALVIEIDGFEELCEVKGQALGDEALVAFATFLAADLREIDYVGRWSSAKFCCVLPRTDGREALECAERVRRKIPLQALIASQPDLRLTASCGVSPAAEGDDPERLLARADSALYRSKRKGKNSSTRIDADGSEQSSAG